MPYGLDIFFIHNFPARERSGGRIQRSYCYPRLYETLLLPIQVRAVDIHNRQMFGLSCLILKQQKNQHSNIKLQLNVSAKQSTYLNSNLCFFQVFGSNPSAQKPPRQLWCREAGERLCQKCSGVSDSVSCAFARSLRSNVHSTIGTRFLCLLNRSRCFTLTWACGSVVCIVQFLKTVYTVGPSSMSAQKYGTGPYFPLMLSQNMASSSGCRMWHHLQLSHSIVFLRMPQP